MIGIRFVHSSERVSSSFSFVLPVVLYINVFLLCLVITWLLQHQPEDRPTALELSQSPLLPQRLEDEYFKSALKLMSMS